MARKLKKRVKITDTILRDAHQSLLATRMKTEDMLPVAEKLDKVGYFSLEVWGGATFDVCLRYLREDPWERLRALKRLIKNTPLQMLLRGQNLVGYRHYPDDVVERFVEKAKENGVDIFRVFDAVNDVRNMEKAIKVAKKGGGIVEGTISYTISPVHTIEQFVRMAKDLENLGCDIICIKDMAGLISPPDAYNLVKGLKKEINLPIHLHSHCTSGVAPISYYAACEAGIDILDTAMSPLSGGTSQPPTETIVGSLKGTPFDTELDLKLLTEIREYFLKVREKYKDILNPISERIDPTLLIHQIPGGMLSNLVSQLKEQNALDKYQDVLKETAEVRKDLGYPPLVTPTSQIVGTQAVMNVILGERYKVIIKEVKDYIRGLYGKPPGPIDSKVKRLAIGDEEPITCRPADLLSAELNKYPEEIKEYLRQEEDVLSYALFPQPALDYFKYRAGEKEEVKKEELLPSRVHITPTEQVGVYALKFKDKEVKVKVVQKKDLLNIKIGEEQYEVSAVRLIPATEEANHSAAPLLSSLSLSAPTSAKRKEKALPLMDKGAVTVPMPGKIVKVVTKVGDEVKAGDLLFILEAMKMENEVTAPISGIVKQVNIKPGMRVESNDVLVVIEGT